MIARLLCRLFGHVTHSYEPGMVWCREEYACGVTVSTCWNQELTCVRCGYFARRFCLWCPMWPNRDGAS